MTDRIPVLISTDVLIADQQISYAFLSHFVYIWMVSLELKKKNVLPGADWLQFSYRENYEKPALTKIQWPLPPFFFLFFSFFVEIIQ